MLTVFQKWPRTFLLSLGVVALQLTLALFAATGKNSVQSYKQLCAWDCGWYHSIAEQGYHSTIPPVPQDGSRANVAFFPGYPLFARMVGRVIQIDLDFALPLTAQIACVFFWFFFLSILNFWEVELWVVILCLLAVLAHPAAFYLVAGYSESLFLASFLGMVYFSYGILRHQTSYSKWGAVVSGFIMTSTRIVGIPLVVFPWLCLPKMQWRKSLLISAGSILGAGLFLLFCQLRFGQMNLYMETQRIGWGIVPDYLAVFESLGRRAMTPWDGSATRLSYLGIWFLFGVELFLKLFCKQSEFKKRLPLYYCMAATFYLTVSGLASLSMRSMIRYSLVWYVMGLLCLANISTVLPEVPKKVRNPLFVGVVLYLMKVFCLEQWPHWVDFLRGRWFA